MKLLKQILTIALILMATTNVMAGKYLVISDDARLMASKSESSKVLHDMHSNTICEAIPQGNSQKWALVNDRLYGPGYVKMKYLKVYTKRMQRRSLVKNNYPNAAYHGPLKKLYFEICNVAYIGGGLVTALAFILLYIPLVLIYLKTKDQLFANEFRKVLKLYIVATFFELLSFGLLRVELTRTLDINVVFGVIFIILVAFGVFMQLRLVNLLYRRLNRENTAVKNFMPFLLGIVVPLLLIVFIAIQNDKFLYMFLCFISLLVFLTGIILSSKDLSKTWNIHLLKASLIFIFIAGILPLALQFVAIALVVAGGLVILWGVFHMLGINSMPGKKGRMRWGSGPKKVVDKEGNEHTLETGILGEISDEEGQLYAEKQTGTFERD